MAKRVAVLQNRIGIGGRNVVIAEFIRLCNDYDLIPHVYSFSLAREAALFRREYGEELRFVFRHLPGWPFRRGNAYQTPLLNLLAAPLLAAYDLIFDSGRCPYFLPPGPLYIHYVHFPLEASLNEEEHLQHFLGYLYTLPLRALYAGRARGVRRGIFLANSQFTAGVLRQYYVNLSEAQVQVVYPPCPVAISAANGTRDLDFVSLGSFVPDKRQLEQISLAARMPQHTFSIIGGLKSAAYFRHCQAAVRKQRLTHVTLYPNASRREVEHLLGRSKIYLHTKRQEHFGISTVEAIAHGCLPLVHDSGGSREIVPFTALRFQTTAEAWEKARQLLQLSPGQKQDLREALQAHIQRFGVDQFRAALTPLLHASASQIQG